jgi:hypothetical protein
MIDADQHLIENDHFMMTMIILVVRNDRSMTENDRIIA